MPDWTEVILWRYIVYRRLTDPDWPVSEDIPQIAPDYEKAFRLAEAVADNLDSIFPTPLKNELELWRSRAAESFIPYGREKMESIKQRVQDTRVLLGGRKPNLDKDHFLRNKVYFDAHSLYLEAARYNDLLPDNFKEEIIRGVNEVYLLCDRREEAYENALLMGMPPDYLKEIGRDLGEEDRKKIEQSIRIRADRVTGLTRTETPRKT